MLEDILVVLVVVVSMALVTWLRWSRVPGQRNSDRFSH